MDKVELLEVVKVTEEVESAYYEFEVTTPKKRKSKAEDVVEKPKKPRSAYLLYYFDVHQIMQVRTPNIPQSEVNKRISESWKRLSVAEKSHYLERAKLEKEGIVSSSHNPCKHMPGFRKILPRGTCFLLPKGGSSNHHPVDSQSLVNMGSPDVTADGGLPSFSLSPLGFAGEAELSEHHIGADNLAREKELMSPPVIIHANPDSLFPKTTTSTNVGFSQTSANFTGNSFTAKEEQTKLVSGCFNGAVVQQTIVTNQNPLETNSLGSVGSLQPVMVIPLGTKPEQNAKPSFKMSVRTYTRRGRGRCLNPSCSFMYVTRHKPPNCPECGKHLGGKWIPAARRSKEKEAATEQPRTEIMQNEGSQTSQQPKEEEKGKINISGGGKERSTRQRCRKRSARSSGSPVGGSTKPPVKKRQIKDNPKASVSLTQSCNSAAVQKRPVRPILPALYNTGAALIQILTVPSDKGKIQSLNTFPSSVPRETFPGLKPSTLKLLGQSVPSNTQESAVPAGKIQCLSSTSNRRVNVLSAVPFKQHSASSFDLGLSTARGRGRCKNPSCDYVYKNRHKPAVCPKCGCGLTQKNTKASKSEALLDPYRPLTPAQKDIQRQSTVQLLRATLQITESETELQETLSLIQQLNSLKIVYVQAGEEESSTETLVESGWPQFYESTATHCGLCSFPLFKGDQGTVAGQEDCWLLTETLMQTASLQLKVCFNTQCLALHSFTDLHPGLFNIGNRLLVSIDLFLKIRANIRLGQSPNQAAMNILDSSHPVHSLSSEESSQIQELLLTGYWAFECVTLRDYNDMICGFCGVAPKIEIAQRCTDSVLELKNVEFTWPESPVPDEVHIDDFWLTMESEAIEQAAFPTDIPITRVDASIIAPFIPPLIRSHSVINTEKDKVLAQTQKPAAADPSVLVRLIHDGRLKLNKFEDHSEEELRSILSSCKVDLPENAAKTDLLTSLIGLYAFVHGGLPTAPQPPAHLTAGRLSKVCPHKVVCSSKYLVRGETARDHVDLLLSSRYWPPVYVTDCARPVALCADLQYPELAEQMWGRNQGCFSDPFEKPELVSCAELQEQPCGGDFSLAESQQVHPVTRSSSRWLVHPPGADALTEHHSIDLCKDLEPYVHQVAELTSQQKDSRGEGSRANEPMVFNNTAYYYLYNRLVDFLSSRDIVGQQISTIFKACQPGEVVIRDALYRLGVAQINSEKDEEEEKTTQ